MGRHRQPFSLIQVGNGYWYFKLGPDKGYRTTGTRDQAEAKRIVHAALFEASQEKRTGSTLGAYAAPFFVWVPGKAPTCPHVRRLLEEGKAIGAKHCYQSRLALEAHLLGNPKKGIPADELADLPLAKIRRGDLLAYRSRLMAKLPGKMNSVNKVVSVLKVIFKDALLREDIERDPTAGIGNVKETRTEAGVFTAKELQLLFPEDSLGPWQDVQDYTCFLLAAHTGMRRGEILALHWRALDFSARLVHVDEAWKDRAELGLPKWNKVRLAPLTEACSRALLGMKEDGIRVGADDLVFCTEAGARLGGTWWTKRFAMAMKAAGIDVRGRNIKAHSFRHTAVTLLLEGGMDPAKVQALVGHSTKRVTDLYTHWSEESVRSMGEGIEKIIGGAT